MKANMVIEISASRTDCVSKAGTDCQFYESWRGIGLCSLFNAELAHEEDYPLRCQACLDTFKEDEK